MRFPLCLNSNTYHGFSLEAALDGAGRAGVPLIELSAVAGYTEHVMPDASDAEIGGLRDGLRERGLRAIALGGHSDLTTADGRAHFVDNLHLAHRLGVGYVVTGTGATHGDESEIEDEGAFAEELRRVADVAAGLGLRVAIETHGANYASGQAVQRLVRRVASRALGIAYDTGNTIFYAGVSPYEDLAVALPDLVGVHLKDQRGGEGVWDFPAIGDGETDFARVLQTLRGAQGSATAPLSIEIEFTPEGPHSAEAVHRALESSVHHLLQQGFSVEGDLG